MIAALDTAGAGERGSVHYRATRSAAIVAAVLLVGAVGFAVAQAALAPHASQIPTVVTASKSTHLAPGIGATVTATVPAAATAPALATKAVPARTSAARADDREVVKRSVRDDSDGDADGSKPSDHDADDVVPSKSAAAKPTPATAAADEKPVSGGSSASAAAASRPAADSSLKVKHAGHGTGSSSSSSATVKSRASGERKHAKSSHVNSSVTRNRSSGK